MRDDESGAALHECVGSLLQKVLRLDVQGRRGLVQQQHLGGRGVGRQLGAGRRCEYLGEVVVAAAAAAVVVVVVVVRSGKLFLGATFFARDKSPLSLASAEQGDVKVAGGQRKLVAVSWPWQFDAPGSRALREPATT